MRECGLAKAGMKIVDRVLLKQKRVVGLLNPATLLGRISFSEHVVQTAQDQLTMDFRHIPVRPHPAT
jgi:hypothetical protein